MDKRLKTFAMYLPQFYRIPENDKWWGEGFSDWVTLKNSDSLFEGHNQPRIPLDSNYYDLSDINVIRWQAKIAKQYGIDGFCMYHYYFENGRKVLEKPAQNLLSDKNIDIEYCFCWANETWARSWTKLYHANSWSVKNEIRTEDESEILLKQDYGNETEWRKHFEYLLPFFKDERYIKKDNKPIFLVYLPDDIPMYHEMFLCFDKWCKEEDFAGIYSIGANVTYPISGMDAIVYIHIRNDLLGLPTDIEIKNGVRIREYEEVWNKMLSLPCVDMIKTYFGGFVDRDDTPRHGARGMCITGGNPHTFEDKLFKLAVKNIHYDNEYMFIDAWNEWGEGCYLEPDEINKFGYLESVSSVMSKVNASDFDNEKEWEKLNLEEKSFAENSDFQRNLNKYQSYYRVLDLWLKINEQGKNLADYFYKNSYRSILIYGYTSLADHLINALKGSDVKVLGYIDRRDDYRAEKLPVFNLESQFPICDAIVVTPIYDFTKIHDSLVQKSNSQIVSIEEIIMCIGID